MNHFKIKVCGITRHQDALRANQLGADMLGFIFYRKSRRYIATTKAKVIIDKLPITIDKVGVFVEPTPNQLLKTVDKLSLDYVQIHGKLSPTLIRELHKSGIRVIQSFHVQNLNNYEEIYKSKADLIHLDNKDETTTGGTGKQFNWALKPPKKIPNLMLAGGIDFKNVRKGLKLFEPQVVDVNSGVESKPGIKSASKLKQFFKFCNSLRYGTKA